jgi:sugar (pentulose or hexulose) kinase
LATSGERAPFSDRYASASFFGLSIRHTDYDLVRAVAEGVAMSLVECLAELPTVAEIYVAGGVSKSKEWCQLLADISGMLVVRPIGRESGTFAVAAFAGVAAGVIEDMDKLLQVEAQYFIPNTEVRTFYDSRLELFGRLRDAIQPLWKSLRLEMVETNV